jgi:HK97 gp10 family phage protein
LADFKLNWRGQELLGSVKKSTPDALFDAASKLSDVAVGKAPKQTGTLAESGYAAGGGQSTYKAGKKNRKEISPPEGGAVMAFAAFYAGFVELGTRSLPAQPFVRPALDELKTTLGELIAKHVRSKLK